MVINHLVVGMILQVEEAKVFLFRWCLIQIRSHGMEFHHHLVEILFMERILHQLIGILSVHSIIYKVLYITGRNMFWDIFFSKRRRCRSFVAKWRKFQVGSRRCLVFGTSEGFALDFPEQLLWVELIVGFYMEPTKPIASMYGIWYIYLHLP